VIAAERIVLRVSPVGEYFAGVDASMQAVSEHIRTLAME
jgi:hypothetical protein